jgi:hypothetical protein
MKTASRIRPSLGTGAPSPRFLRFARALALASGVAPFGCGGVTSGQATDAPMERFEGGPVGVVIHPPMGVMVNPQDARGASDANDDVSVGGYDGRVFGVVPYVPPDAASEVADGVVTLPYDGGILGVIVTGIGPAPEAGTDADGGAAPRDAVAFDVVRYDGILTGGPQAAPAWPADWWATERA